MKTIFGGSFRKLRSSAAIVAVMCVACSSTAHALVGTWAGGTSSDWGTAENWVGGIPPSSGDPATKISAVFGNADSNPLVDLGDSNRSAGGSGDFGITFNDSVNTTIGSFQAKSLTTEYIVVNGGSHQISAQIQGSPNTRIMGHGDLTLGNVNTYTFCIGSNENRVPPTSGFTDTYTSGTVTISGNVFAGGTVLGDMSYNRQSPVTIALGGNITNRYWWVGLLPGIKMTVLPGSHRIDDTSQGVYVSDMAFDGPGNLTFCANTYMDNLVNGQTTYTMNGTGRVIFEGLKEYDVYSMVKAGPGIMEIQGTASYTGATNVTAGTLIAAQPSALSRYLDAKVSVAGGATLAVRGGGVVGTDQQWSSTDLDGLLATNSFTSGSSLGIEVKTGNSFTYANDISGAQAAKGLVKLGDGILTLAGVNTYTGNTNISGGALVATKTTALPGYLAIPNKVSVASGATLAVRAGGVVGLDDQWSSAEIDGLLATNCFAAGSSLGIEVTTGNSFTYGNDVGVTQAAKGLMKLGDGTATIAGGNTYAGVTAINAGILNAGVAETADTSGPFGKQLANAAGSITFGGGTLQYSSANQFDYSGRFSTADNQPISIDTNAQTVTFATAMTSVGGTLTKHGAGTLILSGANAYTGVTAINGGILNAGIGETEDTSGPFGKQLANAAGSITFGGGTLQYSAANQFDYSGRFSTADNQPISIDTNGQTVTFATALFSVGGTVTKHGPGTLILTGANYYTGPTAVAGGTLELGKKAQVAVIGDGTLFQTGSGADIRAGKIVFDYTSISDNPASQIESILRDDSAPSKFATGKIYSSTAAAKDRALGWSDVPNTDPSSGGKVTVMYTLYGDATLDGVVNFDDLSKVLTNYNSSSQNWANGDVTYDGVVNFDDLSKVLTAYNTSIGAGETGSGTPTFGSTRGFTVVPEPSSVVLLIAGLMVYGWRKRK